jgi:hypothetical protein
VRHLPLLVAALPALAGAQAIEPGTWPGSVHFAEGDSAAVRFVITAERNRLLIDVTAPNGTTWTLGDVRADSTRLRFSWAIDGPQAMQCELSRRSAAYWEGHCERRPDRVLVTLHRK